MHFLVVFAKISNSSFYFEVMHFIILGTIEMVQETETGTTNVSYIFGGKKRINIQELCPCQANSNIAQRHDQFHLAKTCYSACAIFALATKKPRSFHFTLCPIVNTMCVCVRVCKLGLCSPSDYWHNIVHCRPCRRSRPTPSQPPKCPKPQQQKPPSPSSHRTPTPFSGFTTSKIEHDGPENPANTESTNKKTRQVSPHQHHILGT